MRFELESEGQARSLMVGLWPKILKALASGRKLSMEIKDSDKSRDQEKLYHELIGQIAKQAQHLGATWDTEDWKRLLVDRFAHEIGLLGGKIIPNLDGTGIVQLGIQTRKFTKEQATQFIEWLHAWADENGVTLS